LLRASVATQALQCNRPFPLGKVEDGVLSSSPDYRNPLHGIARDRARRANIRNTNRL
jgi:hypothetical protein